MNDERVNLGDVCEITSSTRIFANEYRNEGIPFFRSKEIIELGNGATDVTDKYYISKERFNEIKKEKNIPQKGDIFLSAIGANLGEAFINNLEYEFYFKDGNIIWFRNFDTNRILSKYIYYWMKSKDFERQYNNFSIGAAQKALTIDSLKKYKIPILDIEKQQKIVKVLSEIDQKIINNSHINNNLEELAYTFFLHDFANKTANGTIGDIIKENKKSKVKVGDAKVIKGEYPFFTSGESILEWNEYLVDGKNLFLNTGGNADVKFYVGKATYSTDTWSITSKKEMTEYLYLYLKTIKDELDRKFFHGSGLKHLQKPLFKQEKIYIPEQEELISFNNKVKTMFNTISANKIENKRLNSLKEYLLPLLMNGQINVDDIEI